MSRLNRRHTITGAVAAGAGAPLLAACGSDGEDGSGGGAPDATASAGTELGSTSEVPEGGGVIFSDQKVVVTQPSAGEFKGFDSTCTHQGCQVGDVTDGFIHCPCHDSRFAIDTGEPDGDGPATTPLPEVRLTVDGDTISIA